MDDEPTLSKASARGDLETVKKFISEGGADNLEKNGALALKNAAWNGRFEIIKYLIEECGVDVNVGSVRFGCIVSTAVISKKLEIVKYLVEHGADICVDDDDAFALAAYCGHIEIVKYLIKHTTADKLDKALCEAVETNRIEVIEYLMKQGAKMNDKIFNKAPFEVVRYFLSKFINFDALNSPKEIQKEP